MLASEQKNGLLHPEGLLGKQFLKLTKIFKLWVLRDPKVIAIQRWRKYYRHTNILHDFPLDEHSVVFDVGGYRGDYAQTITACYGSQVYLFEPSKPFFDHCQRRFAADASVTCLNYGLSDKNVRVGLSREGDGSSVYSSSEAGLELIQLHKFSEVVEGLEVQTIDLMKLNIEGGEFPVLNDMISSGSLSKVKRLLIQFHDFYPNAEAEREAIRDELQKTHRELWCEFFLWECWERL
ncbi:hypothetical protein GCM10007094_28330 [Pseudovibrio japonicus]|uniref:Methyltransferase FkbM domain-containing protein n=1 Tax=Pseudovibrio japonicus TaxID=366534 RepID=A0ABQ3EFM0_9HYPH|nr:FkbM family methyltransferase [Pseudovibrio japonicus]GHB37044.1 hypothetical protein GCM10007094_28330 [Pseudovibrio japonicus]